MTNKQNPKTPDEIWEGDLFNRRAEATLLIGYIESVVDRKNMREDASGYTIAVDGRYGEGKTFFLKRLAQELSLNHPVAFVDAWADDLADEPLTALAATLKKAIYPHVEKSEELRSKLDKVMATSGKVAKIVGKGVLKKGLGLAITATAVEAAGDVLSGTDEDVREAIEGELSKSGSEVVDEAAKTIENISPGKLMEDRIADFEEGQNAILQMKQSLSALVEALESLTLTKPIIIVIDELDRCRPTYAVKLLEEIKHLFDVPGLVFILGLHGQQLAHSVTGAYGTGFDGTAYLRRFFNRQYLLAEPNLVPLVQKLCNDAGLAANSNFRWPQLADRDHNYQNASFADMTARYMFAYGLHARQAFELVDILQTTRAICPKEPIHIAYFLPLVVGHVLGLPLGELPKVEHRPAWVFRTDRRGTSEISAVELDELASEFQKLASLTYRELSEFLPEDQESYVWKTVIGTHYDHESPIWAVQNYSRLLSTVSRFKNPEIVS